MAMLGSTRFGLAAIGLLAAASASLTVAPSSTETALNVLPASFATPHLSGNYIPQGPPPPGNWHRPTNHDWNGDRGHDGGWDGHPWRWWHDSGIPGARCRDGGGHIDWRAHRCAGGRYDNFKVR
jgi:hypothetical protein